MQQEKENLSEALKVSSVKTLIVIQCPVNLRKRTKSRSEGLDTNPNILRSKYCTPDVALM